MRSFSGTLASKLGAGVTTFAYVWRIARADGQVFAFTDHDQPLGCDALVAEPIDGLTGGVIEKSVGLSPDSASITGALNADVITEADLARGLWDGARVDIYRVDWSAPEDRIHVFAGHIGEVRRGAQAFEAELRGLQAALNVPVGRVFSRFCDADLGDGRCGVIAGAPAYRGVGAVTEILGSHRFRASGISSFAERWFERGSIVFASGARGEIASHRAEGDHALLELIDDRPLALGETFEVFAGCDKRLQTCREKFANAVNFRGFPHMPGNDVIQAGPRTGAQLDGGSRNA